MLSFVKLYFLVLLMLLIWTSQLIEEKVERLVKLSMQFVQESPLDVLCVQGFCLANAEINVLLPVFIAAQVSLRVERKTNNQLNENQKYILLLDHTFKSNIFTIKPKII